ncbi:MAG: hypothetical protein AAFZ87_13600 [Planctomycetota bacterium]
MARTTILIGLLLIALGAFGYLGASADAESSPEGGATVAVGTDADAPATAQDLVDAAEPSAAVDDQGPSVTALIPAFVGGLLVLLGVAALRESARKHAMHGAATVALLGFLAGAGRGSSKISAYLENDPDLNVRSFFFVWIMAGLCLLHVVLCIRSFRAARRSREAESANA